PVPRDKETFVCPSAAGGRNYDHSAYNPRIGWWYNIGWENFNLIRPQKLGIRGGQPLFGGSMGMKAPQEKAPYGPINAFDPLTGERKWRYDTTGINVASLLATGGDLIFSGDVMGNAFALDARTGQKLWSFNTGAGMSGSPISYSVNGRQYIAVPTGMG